MGNHASTQLALRLHREAQANVARAEALLELCHARAEAARLTLIALGISTVPLEPLNHQADVLELGVKPSHPIGECG